MPGLSVVDLIVFGVIFIVGAAIAFGLYWLIRKAVSDGTHPRA